jgi:hypothetical protein
MEADWTQVLDGMVFMRKMTPSTLAGAAPRSQPRTGEERAAVRDFVESIDDKWKLVRVRIRTDRSESDRVTTYVDKVTFDRDYEQWNEVIEPDNDEIATTRGMVTEWFEDQESDPDLAWRTHALLALMLMDEGDRDAAHRELDAAMEAYPVKTYSAPSRLSYFQHLVNRKALLLWDDDGLDAAIDFAAALLASDARYHYFWFAPWRERLESEGSLETWATIRAAVLEAYERRAREFPDEASAIRASADRLPEET